MTRRVRALSKGAAPTAGPPPVTAEEVAVTRAIDQELEWYFSYAETARKLGSITLLPTLEAMRLAAVDDSDEATMRRGMELSTAVQVTLGAVATHHAGVLRAVYTPRRWPSAVEREFGSLTAIAVRLMCADNPWPARNHHDGLETAAAHHLARELADESARPGLLRRKARRLMGSAIHAYYRARAEGGAAARPAR